MNATPTSIKPKRAAIISQSTRDCRSFKCASNMLSGCQGLGFVRLGWLVALLQRLVHLARHRGTGITPRSALLRLDHDDDYVAGVLVRRVGSKPEVMSGYFPAYHPLRGPCFGANLHAWDGGLLAGAFHVFHVRAHGFADDVEAAFADIQLAPDPAHGKGNRCGVREGILGFGPGDQSRPEYFSTIGDGGDHERDL